MEVSVITFCWEVQIYIDTNPLYKTYIVWRSALHHKTKCCSIKIWGDIGKKHYASCVYWICRILIRITILSEISGGMLILDICLCSRLMCHSITVTFIFCHLLSPSLSHLSTFISCWFWFCKNFWGTGRRGEMKPKRTYSIYSERQNSGENFFFSFYVANRQMHLFLILQECSLYPVSYQLILLHMGRMG